MQISKSQIFTWSCFMLTLGLGWGLLIDVRIILGALLFLAAMISLCWGVGWMRVLLVPILAFFLGVHLVHIKQPPDLSQFFERKHDMDIEIIDDPVFSPKSTRFTSVVRKVDENSFNAKLLVTLPRYPEYAYADKLSISGQLLPISEFNLKSNASAEIVFPQVHAVAPGKGNVFKRVLYGIKKVMLDKANAMLPEPESALLGGILLGTRNFSDQLSEQFRITGTAHIVAISGFNVTIVAGIMDGLLRQFGRNVAFYGSVLGIVSLVVITGAQASVVRAGFMGVLVLLAQKTGRVYASLNALFATSAMMLLQNPKLLVFDIGFQLSFAALAGLMFVQPQLDQLTRDFPLKQFLFPTIAAQITTTPLLLYHFGNFSFVSVLANLLVLPVIPWAMLVGFIAVVAAVVSHTFGIIVGYMAWFVLAYVIKIIQFTAMLPAAAVSNIPFPMWMVIMYYLILTFYLAWKPKPSESSNLS